METNVNSNGEALANQEEPKSGIWGQIIGVFTSPSKAFEDYVKKPNILVPLLIVLLGVAAFSMFSLPYNSELQYEIMKTSKTLPPQVFDQMRADMENPNYLIPGIAGPVVVLIIGVIAALLSWGIGTFVFGGKSKYSAVWGVVLMGSIISTIGNLIKIPLMMAKGSALVSIGPAALFPDMGPTSLFFLIMLFLDVFVIWGIYVTGIGYAKAMNISNTGGITTSAIVSLIFIFLMTGMQYVGMKFAGVETTLF